MYISCFVEFGALRHRSLLWKIFYISDKLAGFFQRSRRIDMVMLKNCRGFTLIELVVVSVIVAILAAAVFTILPGNVREARRAEGEAGIMSLTAAMQRYYLDYNTYNHTGKSTTGAVGDTHPLVNDYHADINTKYFDFQIESADGSSFTIAATSKGFTHSSNNGKVIKMKYTRGGTPPSEDWSVAGNTY